MLRNKSKSIFRGRKKLEWSCPTIKWISSDRKSLWGVFAALFGCALCCISWTSRTKTQFQNVIGLKSWMIYVWSERWSTKNWKQFVTQWRTVKLNCSKYWRDTFEWRSALQYMRWHGQWFHVQPIIWFPHWLTWMALAGKKRMQDCCAALETGPLRRQLAMDSCGSGKYAYVFQSAQQPTPTQSKWVRWVLFQFLFILICELPLWICEWVNVAPQLTRWHNFFCVHRNFTAAAH